MKKINENVNLDNMNYVIRYDDMSFKVNSYEEFLDVFYEGSSIDSIDEKENFLIGLIELTAIINEFDLKICNNYQDIKNSGEKGYILDTGNIKSIIDILNDFNIANIIEENITA